MYILKLFIFIFHIEIVRSDPFKSNTVLSKKTSEIVFIVILMAHMLLYLYTCVQLFTELQVKPSYLTSLGALLKPKLIIVDDILICAKAKRVAKA